MKNIAIFASGSGTNAEKICEYFKNNETIKVALILSNRKDAYVLKRADRLNVPFRTFSREDFYKSDKVEKILTDFNIDFIVLAGFLWLLPEKLTEMYEHRIVNIHPALLPDFGGKGMFGHKVHEAVIKSRKKESGITIHYVNNKYDEGEIIFQAKCDVYEDDTPDSLANRIHELEHKHFPGLIAKLVGKIV